MPELDPQQQAVLNLIKEHTDRLDALTTRLAASERTIKALAVAIKETEKETGVSLMPEGSYYGVNFQ